MLGESNAVYGDFLSFFPERRIDCVFQTSPSAAIAPTNRLRVDLPVRGQFSVSRLLAQRCQVVMSRVVAFRPRTPARQVYPDIAGRRILISNATHGAGAVIAHAFAAHGCRLVLQSADRGAAAQLAEEVREEAESVRVFGCALSDSADAGQLAAAAARAFDGIEVVVNLFDFSALKLNELLTCEACEERLAGALRTQTDLAEVAAEQMHRKGRQGVIAHVATLDGEAFGGAVGSLLRHAVATLTAAMARAWEDKGVHVYAVVAEEAGSDRALEEIAGIALMLAGGNARLNGQVFTVGR